MLPHTKFQQNLTICGRVKWWGPQQFSELGSWTTQNLGRSWSIIGAHQVCCSHPLCCSILKPEYLKSQILHFFTPPPITRNSSGDEIANVNFLTNDIVHALQNTIDSYINSTTDRRHYVLEHRFTKVSEITQCNGHYAVQGHSRSPILVPIESSYTTSY